MRKSENPTDRWWRSLALISGTLYLLACALSVSAAFVPSLGGGRTAEYLVLGGLEGAIGAALVSIRRPIHPTVLHLQGIVGTGLTSAAIALGDPVWVAFVPFYAWMAGMFSLLVRARGLALQLAAVVVGFAVALVSQRSWGAAVGGVSWLLAIIGLSLFIFRARALFGRRVRAERDRLEIELKEELARRAAQEEQYESLVQSIPGVVYRCGADRRWTASFVSDGVLDLTGYRPEEVVAGAPSLGDMMDPDDAEQVWAISSKSLLERVAFQVSYRIARRDGEVRWVENWARPTEGPDGLVLEGILFDVTDEVTAREQRDSAWAEYRHLVETIPLITYTDGLEPRAPTVYSSPQLADLLGYPVQDWYDDPDMWVKLLHPDDRVRAVAENQLHLETGRPFRMEYRLRTRDGSWRWFLDEAVIVHDGEGNPVASRGFMVDVTQQKELEQQLSFQAFHDSLTGLANRALFRDRLEHALTRRREGPVAVVYVDLDDFKAVNDSLGHAVGDDVVRVAAERMLRAVRRGDTVARLGGDEFGILVEHDAETGAYRVAEAVLAEFERPMPVGGREFEVGVSIGTALSADWMDAETLIQHADLAMYAAKTRGKGRIEAYTDALTGRARDRLQVRTDLRRALADGDLEMFFQPIVDLATSRAVGAEALLRWNHPTKGWVPPADFIPIAEEAGLVVELGRWAVREASEAGVRIREELGLSSFFVTVNLSARELTRDDLPGFIGEVVASSGLGAGALVVEMTESYLLTDPEAAIDCLHALRGRGLRVALDDFGTGYSSLSYLARMPVDILKIAKPFVDALGTESREERLVEAVVGLCADLELAVVAEGIERVEQAVELRRAGCAMGQGFLYAPAQSADSFASVARSLPAILVPHSEPEAPRLRLLPNG